MRLGAALSLDRLAHALGDDARIVEPAARHEHEELVPAGADADVVLPDGPLQDVREAAECEIAHLVAERVVHLLQTVDVDRDRGVALAVACRERLQDAQLRLQEVAVGETGEAIRRRLPLGRLEHTPRREAEGDAVRGGAQDGHIEDRLLVGFEEERTHGVAAGDEGHA